MYSMMTYQQEWENFQKALFDLWKYQSQAAEQIKDFYAANPVWKDAQQVTAELMSVKGSYDLLSFFRQCWMAPAKSYQAFEDLINIILSTDKRLLESGQHMGSQVYKGGEKAAEIMATPALPIVTMTELINNHLETLKSLEGDQQAIGTAINGFNSALKIWSYQLMTPEAPAEKEAEAVS